MLFLNRTLKVLALVGCEVKFSVINIINYLLTAKKYLCITASSFYWGIRHEKKKSVCLDFFSSFSTTNKSCSFCSESICQLRQPILPTPPERPRREFLLCLPGISQLCLTDLQLSWQRAEQPAEHLL